jgi:hypothetical protein
MVHRVEEMTDIVEPSRIVAGDSASWTKNLPQYLPASGWVLSYAIVRDGVRLSITGTNNGDGTHLVSLAAATTGAWTPGQYAWQAYVTKAATSERVTIASGQLKVEANFAAGAVDARSHAKKTLDALEATLEGRASSDQLAYSIGGRSISKMAPEQLLTWRDKDRAEVAAEEKAQKVAAGLGASGTIRVRM